MEKEILEQGILLFVLVILSGFFSGSETALFSISRIRVRYLGQTQNKTNKLICRLRSRPHTLLSTILIGNNLVNISASAIATSLTIEIFDSNAIGIATGVMTFLILIFGEIFPKSLATQNSLVVSRFVIYPIYWLSIIFWPIIKFLDFIPKITGRITHHHSITEEELKTIVEVSHEEGAINEDEKELIKNIFRFDEISASEIMTPRTDMYVVASKESILAQIPKMLESGFTRFPVINQDTDDVIGILNIKDVFKIQEAERRNVKIKEIMRKPCFVPDTKKLDNLLEHFKLRKEHMAIVVDEHGGVAGLITLENVLEELVGEITDETDQVEPRIIKIKGTDLWDVPGNTDIEDVNKKLKIMIPESEEYDTLSGFVLKYIQRIPEEGEKIKLDNCLIIIKTMDSNRIKELTIDKSEKDKS